MFFLGLGTGLGSALIIDGVLEPTELAHLLYKHGKTFEEYVGAAALKLRGKKKWIKDLFEVVAQLKNARCRLSMLCSEAATPKKLPHCRPTHTWEITKGHGKVDCAYGTWKRRAGQSAQPRFQQHTEPHCAPPP
jgi:hypothetical protein